MGCERCAPGAVSLSLSLSHTQLDKYFIRHIIHIYHMIRRKLEIIVCLSNSVALFGLFAAHLLAFLYMAATISCPDCVYVLCCSHFQQQNYVQGINIFCHYINAKNMVFTHVFLVKYWWWRLCEVWCAINILQATENTSHLEIVWLRF